MRRTGDEEVPLEVPVAVGRKTRARVVLFVMSARDQMTKMLDQLMGQNRDGDNKAKERRFTDSDVCRPFLLGICINDLFINTREEMGDCEKIHSIALKNEYERAQQRRDYHFEEEVLEYLQSFIKENERKIEINKKRIENVEEDTVQEKLAQEIHEYAVLIGEKVTKSELLGNEGNIDESLLVLQQVEEIKLKKKKLEDEYHAHLPRHAQQQQKLRACEVCGAFLSMYDNDRRLADHFGGKLHMGFVQIREKMETLGEIISKKKERLEKEREERKKQRSRSRSKERGGGDPEKEGEKDKDGGEKSRDRDGERSRDRDGERSRDRDRDRGRDRDRDRGRDRDRDRARRRSYSNQERRRSRERDRYNGSRGRSRSRSRERR